MAVKLHRCRNQWVKLPGHPCWRVEKALIDAGVEYDLLVEKTGVDKYPAIEFDDGTWYRDESKEMAAVIRAGRLDELHGKTPAAETTA
jgi:hypothetical protein